MKRTILSAVLVLMIAFTFPSYSHADQVVYQPEPFQGKDMWLSSVFNTTAVDEWRLQTGGWGDEYRFLIKFDLDGLPANATSAVMYMLAYGRGDSSTLVGMYIERNTTDWNESTTVYGQTLSQTLGSVPAPTPGWWYGLNITGVYNLWKSGAWTNYGFKFRPTGTNNQFSQFLSSDLSSVNHTLRPKLVITYDGANFGFPLKGTIPAGYLNAGMQYGPYIAPISAVIDHSNSSGFNCTDNVVTAYTGEKGEVQYGSSIDTVGPSDNCPNDVLYGFKQQSGLPFSVNGQYSAKDGSIPNNLFLFYDGHTGIDYPAPEGTFIYAAAAGTVTIPIPNSYGEVQIDHGNGYSSYYVHLGQIDVATGFSIGKGMKLGEVGTLRHLHFTVKKNGQRVDPYGWKGKWGTDPLQIDGKDNVCLWEVCQ